MPIRFEVAPHHLVDEFKRHVAETGQPEAFPGICNDMPPIDGHVEALCTDVSINRKRRPLGDMAPCPICCREKPKWLDNGTLIWCAATQFIYAIGPQCYRTHWLAGKLDIELNRLRRTQMEQANAQSLARALAAAPENLQWVRAHLPPAVQANSYQRMLVNMAPQFTRAISRQQRTGIVTLVRGLAFLKGKWILEERLRRAEKELVQLLARADGRPADTWAAELAPRQVEQLLEDHRRAKSEMGEVAKSLTAASAFLTPHNIHALAALSRDCTVPFTATISGSKVLIRADGARWEGPLNFPAPGPLPT